MDTAAKAPTHVVPIQVCEHHTLLHHMFHSINLPPSTPHDSRVALPVHCKQVGGRLHQQLSAIQMALLGCNNQRRAVVQVPRVDCLTQLLERRQLLLQRLLAAPCGSGGRSSAAAIATRRSGCGCSLGGCCMPLPWMAVLLAFLRLLLLFVMVTLARVAVLAVGTAVLLPLLPLTLLLLLLGPLSRAWSLLVILSAVTGCVAWAASLQSTGPNRQAGRPTHVAAHPSQPHCSRHPHSPSTHSTAHHTSRWRWPASQ